MSDRKEMIYMLEGLTSCMEDFVKNGKTLATKLAEEDEAEQKMKQERKRLINSLYGTMMTVPPCGRIVPPCNYGGLMDKVWLPSLREGTASHRAPKSLDGFTWGEIDAINRRHATQEFFRVGDTKTVTLKNGEKILLRIIGLYHDEAPDGVKVPITWEMTHYMKDAHAMNDDWTNKGGWAESEMRKYLQEKVLPLLPDELLDILQPVKKETSCGNRSKKLQFTVDKLFLLSEWERYGRCFYSACQEGRWYPWYAQEGVSYVKTYPDGDNGWGWSRSPNGSSATRFCTVDSIGDANYYDASLSRGVAFGFCI